ncbi:hypothetical protein P4605_10295 [Priestia aryabhattai]|uniref:hypothetical protein n=1 Tax=Priestia aryabhattai TaxID=412384 RepID=UPI002E244AC7|nr:hypothetical protein [Priestia aryabhattai]
MELEWIKKADVVKSRKYEKIAKTYKGFNPWIEQGYITTKEGPGKTMTAIYFKRKDLEELLELIDSLENDYVPDKEAAKLLGFEGKNPIAGAKRRKEILDGIITLCKSEKIDYKYFDNSFKRTYLFVDKKQFTNFLELHVHYTAIMDNYRITSNEIYDLEKKYNIQRVAITKYNYFFKLEDVNHYFNIPQYDENDFYSLDEVLSIFTFKNKTTLDSFRKQEYIEPVFIKGKTFYSKESIEVVLEQIKEIKNNYCTAKSVMDICNLTSIPKQLTAFPVNLLHRQAFGGNVKVMYLLNDVYEYKEQIEYRDKINQAFDDLSNPVEVFEQILSLKKISFSEKSPYTEKEWYLYCKQKLFLSKSNRPSLRALITDYVSCTTYLSELTAEKELYSLTSNDINLRLFNNLVGHKRQSYLYSFLLSYHENIILTLAEESSKKKIFNMGKIINPYLYEPTEKPKETYGYTDYIDLYNYSQQMTHKHQAILDAESIINKEKQNLHYASSWLYVLTHLGNAWRHSDVMKLPIVDLNSIGICSLETLKERDLTTKEANSIVKQIERKDLTVEKTGATNRFNCPDDLMLPFATAAVICSLIVMKTRGIVTDSNNNVINDSIIDFGLKENSSISDKAHNAFFSNFNKENFKFQSLKMNRTVLVLMYMILLKKGKGNAALEMAQRLRAHEDFETTNIYLVIPAEELDALCESLFNRKHFGYIPDLMATILLGANDDRNERTQEIITLTSTFGSVHKLQATSGFINKVLSERQKVADKIFSMGIDEVNNLMFDLQTNTLTSREENFQCIVSPDCQKPELESCKECPFAIPNFYALASITSSFKDSIFNFVRDFEPDSFEGEKTRLVNILYRDLDNLERAMQKFGQTEVLNFFQGGKEEYNNLLELIDKLQSETVDDFEKHLTYKPMFLA